jgi:hypothetical protein
VHFRPGVRKHAGRGQLASVVGKSSIGEEAAPAMSIPLDLSSTEDHGHHLQNEAAPESPFTLRPSDALVKSERSKAVAGWRQLAQRETIPLALLDRDHSLVGLGVDAQGTSSSLQ